MKSERPAGIYILLQSKNYFVSVDKQANNDDVFQFECEGRNHMKTEFQKTLKNNQRLLILNNMKLF